VRALLDISVWLPLLDQAHVFAERANDWFARAAGRGKLCPIVENGVVRTMSQPGYSKELPQTPGRIAELLARASVVTKRATQRRDGP
jgi:predicted nucleic acid-binding protein